MVFRGCGFIIESNQKNKKLEWILKKEEAFLILEKMFTKKPILAMFNPVKKIIIEININKIVLNAILSQPDEKNDYIRLYFILGSL